MDAAPTSIDDLLTRAVEAEASDLHVVPGASPSIRVHGDLAPLPDIERTRNQWPIVSWAVEPGDLIVFHPAMLHGGAPTSRGERRRTISLRFFGDLAFCAERPEQGLADVDRLKRDDGGRDPIEQMATMPAGTLFRHPGFLQVL